MKTMLARSLFALAFALGAPAYAQEQPQPQPQPPPPTLGGPGESCRARADCKANLKCMNQVCTDQHEGETCGATSDCGGELRCVNNKCASTIGASHGGSAGGPDMTEWMNFKLTDGNVHPFIGLTVAGGFDTIGASGNAISGGFNTFDGAVLFALNGGIFIGNHQLMFEVAPVTFVYDAKFAPGPVFEMTANYAYFIPLTDAGNIHVYWPIRFGLGMLAGPDLNALGLAYFQLRADLIGVAVQMGHVIIDMHLPSFRYSITDKSGSQLHLLDWVFGVSLGYAF
jgi:hypothetical protein